MTISAYDSLVFDCDGVILDSNRVKTEAFRQATLPYGETAVRAMVDFHVARGGISRYEKFRYFLDEIAGGGTETDLEALLERYTNAVQEGLRNCAVAPGLDGLRAATPHANWLVVSGGDQMELRQIFAERKLDYLFDGGIFGSPDDKIEILTREQASGTIRPRALFLGDSRYDHIAASSCGLDFIFISGWSEFQDWQIYLSENDLTAIQTPQDLLHR